jgi:hypothetical protein
MKKAGIVILTVGLIIAVFTATSFITRKKVVEIGSLEVTARRKYTLEWSPLIGAGMIVVGAVLCLVGSGKKKT